MVTATELMRFLPFLAPAEESNLLTEGPVKEFDRNDLVLEQNVIVRAIFLIEEGSVRVERQEKGQKVPAGRPWRRRVFWRDVLCRRRTNKC